MTMDWPAIGGITASITVIMAVHAGLITLIIDRAIMKALLKINKDFVTREEFDRHVKQCPHTRGD